MKKAMLWHGERNGIRCDLCARKCFIPRGKSGFCQVRINKDNTLYTLTYGKLCTLNVDPIEKKPLFHFYPGSRALSIATLGCNFKCSFCCNHEISQAVAETGELKGETYSPRQVVALVKKYKCKIISYTYTEPTIFFEFAYATTKEAVKENILNTFVTNGYMSDEAIKKISKHLDAVTVDFKASGSPEFYKKFMGVPTVKPIYRALRQFKKQRVFIEITNLIVPQLGDDIELCGRLAEWVNTELGSEVPFHIIQFHPSFRMMDIPSTPVKTLEMAIREARDAGLRYVYIGNVLGHRDESTYCYNCGELLIERVGYEIRRMNLVGDRCPNCSFKINLEMGIR
ncbi:MAG: AmmeMemoRadiSam system radical SAM enzyme [Candidatus Aenigmarchaeota archaeon]|nr:AmmeMemoRadiSam system radical SAM enzyme [Candidatus Aenigmarchaeota archaeon]